MWKIRGIHPLHTFLDLHETFMKIMSTFYMLVDFDNKLKHLIMIHILALDICIFNHSMFQNSAMDKLFIAS